jgi:hypothetical protein
MSISDSGKYDLLDQLAEEFAARFRRGERPALKEYTDRYPELAEGAGKGDGGRKRGRESFSELCSRFTGPARGRTVDSRPRVWTIRSHHSSLP